MKLVRWLIGGGIGAALGAALWMAVIHFTGYELGFIAWGVGGLAGLGIALTGDQDLDGGSGILGAGLAIAAILIGKLLILDLYTGAMMDQFEQELSAEDAYVSTVADRIIARDGYTGAELEAMAYPQPSGSTEADLAAAEDLDDIAALDLHFASGYPIEIWAEAESEWQTMAPAEQQAIVDEHQQTIAQMRQAFADEGPGLGDILGLFDALWIFLAAGTAYKLGAHGCGITLNLGPQRQRPPGWRTPIPGRPSCGGCGSAMEENDARCQACGRAETSRVTAGSGAPG